MAGVVAKREGGVNTMKEGELLRRVFSVREGVEVEGSSSVFVPFVYVEEGESSTYLASTVVITFATNLAVDPIYGSRGYKIRFIN